MTTPLNNKKGTTLVELMVCLVLLALFGVAAVTLVKPSAEAYISIQQLTRAQNLADALTDSIRGELSTADGTIAIVNAAVDKNTADSPLQPATRATQGDALRFTVTSNYFEVLDAGYVPKLTTTAKNADTTTEKILYDPADTTSSTLDGYLHMRFYTTADKPTDDTLTAKYPIYAYTTAYPNGDYMGLVISNLKFYARGWKKDSDTGKVYLTSLTMQLTVANPTTNADGTVTNTPVYTQTAIIPLPGTPEFN